MNGAKTAAANGNSMATQVMSLVISGIPSPRGQRSALDH
jgi:hypothetical protein